MIKMKNTNEHKYSGKINIHIFGNRKKIASQKTNNNNENIYEDTTILHGFY